MNKELKKAIDSMRGSLASARKHAVNLCLKDNLEIHSRRYHKIVIAEVIQKRRYRSQ